MEAPESVLVAGSTLDRYELLCPLAEGGMAAVWLARMRGTRGFEKLVAIKTIKAELVDDPRFEEMFLDEARIAAEIAHPNVAQIIDLGEMNGVLYLVMEWVDGESLAKVRKLSSKAGVRIPLGLCLRMIADACAGLHAAHELKAKDGTFLGVVHRDVSPQNILVATSGAVKVIDFGVAKAQNRLASRTRTGIVKGKLQYMAPEQAKGERHDRRVDVWALGVCLYELVADRLPFDAENPLELLTRITSEDPPSIADFVPSGVRDVVAQALARNPDERFASAAAMRRAIEVVLGQLGLHSSSEDVAAFVDAYMPQRTAERQDIVAKALKAAEGRVKSGVDVFNPTLEVNFSRQSGASESDSRLVSPHTPSRGSQPPMPSQVSRAYQLPSMRHPAPSFSARALMEDAAPPSKVPLYVGVAAVVLGALGFGAWRMNLLGGAAAAPTAAASASPSAIDSAKASATPSASVSAAPVASAAPAESASAGVAAAAASASAAPSAAPSAVPSAVAAKPSKHSWPKAAEKPAPTQRNTDWLPKESEIPKIATPPPSPPAADPPTTEAAP